MPSQPSVCTPDATTDLYLKTRCPYRPLCADPMTHISLSADAMPLRPLSADKMPPQTICLQTGCPQRTFVCRPEVPMDLCLQN